MVRFRVKKQKGVNTTKGYLRYVDTCDEILVAYNRMKLTRSDLECIARLYRKVVEIDTMGYEYTIKGG